ncbi:MmcQ/YjbR family DNA-binding protein [Lutispora sp.]|uniref:MmcQ/YjbR family DNA-binding protein n=1 Tax=Lutispora sp. TaxID=2828727 RepID=UPI0035665F54
MTKDELIEYCRNKPGVTVEFPFDSSCMSFKLVSKFFAFMNINKDKDEISLKCDPWLAVAFREQYEGVTPGYHLNKKHWNTVDADLDVPKEKVLEMIDMSYNLIHKSLKKQEREALSRLGG